VRGLLSASAAQTVVNAGTVRGVVNDKSGAVVPEAAVVLLSRGSDAVAPNTLEAGSDSPGA